VIQVRRSSEQKLYRASLQNSQGSVTKEGRVLINGFVSGKAKAQQALYKFFDFRKDRAKEKFWVGVNPSDYSQPTVIYNSSGRPTISK